MFSRFARAQDASSRTARSALIGGTLLVVWTLWFFLARVSLYETSRQARIEVESAPHDVDAPVAGRLLRTNLVLDKLVSAGDVLIELDSEAWQLERQAEESKMLAVAPQIAALERELLSDEDALRGEDRALSAEVSEARARQRATDAVAHLKASERDQVESLHKQHVVADVEQQRTQADYERQTAESQAARAQVGRLGTEGVVRKSDRRAKIARLEAEIARLQSVRARPSRACASSISVSSCSRFARRSRDASDTRSICKRARWWPPARACAPSFPPATCARWRFSTRPPPRGE
jgi:multidrug resistance efflux pump